MPTMSKTPLLDNLRARVPLAPWWLSAEKTPAWRAHRDQLLAYLRDPQLPAFNIAPIAEYFYEINPREYWDFGELEGLRAPCGVSWMEHPLPKTLHSEIGDQNLAAITEGHAGFLVFDVKRADVQGEGIPAETDRVLLVEIFVRYEIQRRTEGPHGAWVFALDSAGRVLDVPWMQGFHHPRHNEHVKLLQSLLWPALLAMSNKAVSGLRQPAWVQ